MHRYAEQRVTIRCFVSLAIRLYLLNYATKTVLADLHELRMNRQGTRRARFSKLLPGPSDIRGAPRPARERWRCLHSKFEVVGIDATGLIALVPNLKAARYWSLPQ